MQDDLVDNFPMAEFAASNYINMSTGVILFFANYSFYFRTGMEPLGIYKSEQKAELLAIDKIVKKQGEMMIFLQDQLAWVQNKQTQFAN